MATVLKTTAIMTDSNFASPPALPNYTPADRDLYIQNYWGSINKILNYFVIDYAKMDELFEKSPHNEVALKISNLGSKDKVSGIWMPYDKNNEKKLKAYKNKDHYFIFERRYYDLDFQFIPDKKKGGIRGRPNTNVVCALLGKDNNGKYYAFINAANIVIDDGGTGGNGFTSGAKIPR